MGMFTTASGVDIGNDSLLSIENIIGGQSDDLITGDQASNYLDGFTGNDVLMGLGGDDVLVGGSGIDTAQYLQSRSNYVISRNNDGSYNVIDNQGGDGKDILFDVELVSFNDITINIGSILNKIEGNQRINFLLGTREDDEIFGYGSRDFLLGGAGDDYLDGGQGADILFGGNGDDVYVVDNSKDKIIEIDWKSSNLNGVDLVKAYVSWRLGNSVENLTLEGEDSISGFGNSLNNTINGNFSDNLISGLSGNDNLNGLAGNDTLIGGLGSDIMTGGTGVDVFKYLSERDSNTLDISRDTITDFESGIDILDLTDIDAVFSSLGDDEFTFIGSDEFDSGNAEGQLRFYFDESSNIGYLEASLNFDVLPEFSIGFLGLSSISISDIYL